MEFPRPSFEQVVEEYEALYHSNPLRWDDPGHDRYIFEMVKWHLRGTQRGTPESMLDFGCGSGHTLEYFARRWPSTRLYGLDLSKRAVEITQKRVPRASCLAGSIETATFPEAFEFITAVGVLEHCPDPVRTLSRMRDLLSPAGIAYVEVPDCIAYPESEKGEGFRKLNTGSRQWEWHLHRRSWHEQIRSSGLSMNLSLSGPSASTRFIWILSRKKEPISFFPLLRIHTYGIAMRARERTLSDLYRFYRRARFLRFLSPSFFRNKP